MQKNKINNIIMIIGLLAVVATLFVISEFTSSLATALCVKQNFEDTVVCTPNIVPAFLITLFTPLLIGTALIVISVLKRKK